MLDHVALEAALDLGFKVLEWVCIILDGLFDRISAFFELFPVLISIVLLGTKLEVLSVVG